MTSNVFVIARPGTQLRSIGVWNKRVDIIPPPVPGEANQEHFREFWYSGAEETFTVPGGFYGLLEWDLYGAPGGFSNLGGFGLRVQGTSAPSIGASMEVRVGGKGSGNTGDAYSSSGAGGYNGGGTGGDCAGVKKGGGGGGATDIRIGGSGLANRIASAPGGGGGEQGGSGANAGYPNGDPGESPPNAYGNAGGGTQSAGGVGGRGMFDTNNGSAGAVGVGGNGGHQAFDFMGGGGGGGAGYYGGGGGNGNMGGNPSGTGGGGSALISGLSSVSTELSPRGGSKHGFATVAFHIHRSTEKPDDLYSYRRWEYTGAETGFVIPMGVYWIKFKLIGGNGSSGAHTGGTGAGGAGGKGGNLECWLDIESLELVPGDILELRVGQNSPGVGWVPSPPHFEPAAAAYNGGGSSGSANSSVMGGGGGGATDIRKSPYTLDDRLLVAGGGGGGNGTLDGSFYPSYGGNAGLPDGQNGGSFFGTPGLGGTQTSGYAFGIGQSGPSSGAPGAGGGWWGGTSSETGGGGSSHIPDGTPGSDYTHTARDYSDYGITYIEARW